jgi:hypothetical protein
MKFKVAGIETYTSPLNLKVDSVLEHYLTTYEKIENTLMDCILLHNNLNQGFQIELHDQLQKFS